VSEIASKQWLQIGIVSFGGLSCSKSYPIAFTATKKYLDWIKNQINIFGENKVTATVGNVSAKGKRG
jgi:secreted trypsin-like serine protease